MGAKGLLSIILTGEGEITSQFSAMDPKVPFAVIRVYGRVLSLSREERVWCLAQNGQLTHLALALLITRRRVQHQDLRSQCKLLVQPLKETETVEEGCRPAKKPLTTTSCTCSQNE